MSTQLLDSLKMALIRELEELHQSVKSLAEELTPLQLWQKPLLPGNSVGHLILHLTGNINHFVGAGLGKTEYVRDREREFTETQTPGKDALLKGLDDAVQLFRKVVGNLTEEEFTASFPEARFGTGVNALVHWVSHFALHRGQMSYIVRSVGT